MKLPQRQALVASLAVALPVAASAQEKIQSGLQQATTWAAVIVSIVGVLALMYAGAKKMWGDPTANQHLAGVVIGGIIALGASGIMAMMRNWFGG